MEPFTTHTGTAAPLRLDNVDTDQIMPARFAAGASRTAYAHAMLHDRRAEPDFVLNRPEHRDATILVAGDNFGCGSSREFAVWALQNYGFHAVIAPSFGAIFRDNSLKNGLLTVILPSTAIEELWQAVEADPALAVTVDLTSREVRAGDRHHVFEFDDYQRWRLLNGFDDITLTLRHLDAIEAYERTRRATLPLVRRTAAS
ncbi:3-isopropylmalate dehydratase small subunit [Amycolatopsis sp. YIM 10]|uniref:3-isopropylmalate dehydratase small subunit n=1 Tax=Amycolatopsis sp. YIM 10 TaxID=2653857 RepID=UPI0012902EBE|nr:3-isopropylmalate dehydratase small subunit [Amycolatopsis sp. YIM 10]QFU88333.1 3-isopropylmalate dehydratase small subunit [Amycolatopsis sp. YIM 10]